MARDKYHYHVKEALIKDGWTITHDPYYIISPGLNYPVDCIPKSDIVLGLQSPESRALSGYAVA